ncbi:helitron_like_N domain-containing protein [Nephila pilipes]|uniref:Helitron_like_N domain-containing protein n=1 Tax=Nephila pilipes TaxID=299642 RepID=A0A8X6QV06_NEPPI|nr:helitron_like_N domain-containing protein [Nephila pilipes]GFT78019.1 helitron_like_N domain-containing protein [Nephila pilipes]GFT92398.1 helitron_like_N domain-containing protein [Nephila pilipes]GFU46277.1 helitron_like_N domain-containing protein [Nephila pilipes]
MIYTCGKKIRGKEGAIEDVHLQMRSIRGSSAYWRIAMNELIAFIKCVDPPTWFITPSCNDLKWLYIRKALLIANKRPDVDPASICIDEAQQLIEMYPVVLSRHFSRRINAFMPHIKRNPGFLGGQVVDHWWRIEFQNRGSPHLNLLVWIKNEPSFDTPAGIALINKVDFVQLSF